MPMHMHAVCLGHVVLDGIQPLRCLGQYSLLLWIYVCILFRTLRLHLPRHGCQRHGHRHILVHRNSCRNDLARAGRRFAVLSIHDPPDASRPCPVETADHDQVQVQIRRAYSPACFDPPQPAVVQSVGLCVCSRGRFRRTNNDGVYDEDPETKNIDREFA